MQSKIKIQSINIQNFKGVKNATYQFDGKNVSVIGQNATGKTTIADSLWWLLFNKDSDGNEKFSIRPLDSDGKQIDNVEICVSAVLDIDGNEMELKKVQKQNWVKKRGASEIALQGNVNSYEVDGYPKSEKEYKECVAGISEEELFKILTNPFYLPNLKWNEKRSRIIVLADDIPDIEVARKNERFAGLLPDLEKAKSTDDIKKKYQKALNEWKKKQSELPVRIDEAEKQKVEIDVADLELLKNSLNEQIAENKAKQEDISKVLKEQDKASNGILEMKFELNDLQRKANEENNKKRLEIQNKLDKANSDYDMYEAYEAGTRSRIKSDTEKELPLLEQRLKEKQELWKSVNVVKIDEDKYICPTCHRELPEEEKENILSNFEETKKQRLEFIIAEGEKASQSVKDKKKYIEDSKKEVEEYEKKQEEILKQIEELEKQLSLLPENINISDRPEVQEIQRQIAEKEATMNKGNSAEEMRQQLKDEAEELQKKMDAVKEQFVLVKISNEADDRIAELQTEQREVAQKVADQEKMIDLLEEFIRFKMDRVSDTINQKLDGICVKLFENQINGGVKECCELTYDGVPYGSLNNGHRIVAGLKIIKALQEFYGIYAPVFINNAESINDFNLPEMDTQIISLKVTEDKELKIEMEG